MLHVTMQRLFALLVLSGLAAVAPTSGALADSKTILIQKVMLTGVMVNGQLVIAYVGVGKGPFSNMYPLGICATATCPQVAGVSPVPLTTLTQGRIDAAATAARDFGSIGASQGSIIRNNTGSPVTSIMISTKGMTNGTANTINPNSMDGQAFTTALTNTSVTFTAGQGDALAPVGLLWMLIPPGPQPGMPGAKIYTGQVTLMPPAAPPPAPAPAAPMAPAAGNTSGAGLSYNAGTSTISFNGGNVSFATYVSGTTATTNGPTENVIGSQIQIGDMQVLGPSSSVPGAFQLSDSGVALVQNGQTILQGELINDLLIPDPSVPGDAEIQGSLSIFEEGEGLGSEYIDEYFADSLASDLFVNSNLLAVTDDLTQDGDATGSAVIASVASVPEPSSIILLATGLSVPIGAGLATRRRRQGRLKSSVDRAAASPSCAT
jgi:hypothetical protein